MKHQDSGSFILVIHLGGQAVQGIDTKWPPETFYPRKECINSSYTLLAFVTFTATGRQTLRKIVVRFVGVSQSQNQITATYR
jgi:hypothetical protein